MINGVGNLGSIGAGRMAEVAGKGAASPGESGGASFSDALRKSIDEVSKLQEDASRAVEDVMTGKSDNVSGVMTAVEKSDLAFKTLLAIRAKLMEAYEEIKSIQI
ncbi:MAG TPA: flagellar hook-basal body complex protein FliE [Tepidisphaeraceae bacterium]|jgi:flagellar hook-basal body complex protein FliE|nr:flagellar hook-basal body complex protein FliE [Tepidisphaeraceae bacterium]HEV8604149.1 flagellar hook-basal body complex protein FliE [Tepidisphaeraceae bacterium]